MRGDQPKEFELCAHTRKAFLFIAVGDRHVRKYGTALLQCRNTLLKLKIQIKKFIQFYLAISTRRKLEYTLSLDPKDDYQKTAIKRPKLKAIKKNDAQPA